MSNAGYYDPRQHRTSAGGRCALLLSAMAVQTAPVKWEISGLTFADGGSGSGYFVFDADTAAVSDWKIDVTGGSTNRAASDSIQRKQLRRQHYCRRRLDLMR